ncbi:MAG: hypothetical protein M3Y27_12625 [Acidobacteriota bacterium]|nr:hypothetical protein [Acidobacteriota bacterium]
MNTPATFALTNIVPVVPTADSVGPSSGSGATQTFAFAYTDTNSYTDIAWTYALFNTALTGANACYVQYNRPTNTLYLVDDTGGGYAGAVAAGSAGTVQNSQCSLNGAASSASGVGNTLTVSVALTFKPAFAGTKAIFSQARSAGGLSSNWQNKGTWFTATSVVPSADSVTPSSGNGATQTFAFAYTDTNGYADIAWTYALFNTSLSGANACYVQYNRPNNTLYLVDDSGGSYAGPVVAGSAGAVQNSQCSLSGSASSVSGAGNTLTVNVAPTFKPAFAGSKAIFTQAVSVEGLTSNWQIKGTWSTATAVAPTADSVTPSSGNGATQTFAFAYTDTNGYSDITWTYALFNTALTGGNACFVQYNRLTNTLYLVDDSGANYAGSVVAGSAGTVQNSQCSLSGPASSVTGNGNTLTVNVALTFKPAFAGTKAIFSQAVSSEGLSSNWQNRGTWSTVTAVAPTADSVTPSSGSGTSQTFAFAYTDTNGASDIAWTYSLFNTAPSGGNACYVQYNRPTNTLYLVDDSGLSYAGSVVVGSVGTVQNSQCTLSGATSSVSVAGNALTVNVALTFKPAFAGAKAISSQAVAAGGLASDWQNKGTWTVQ